MGHPSLSGQRILYLEMFIMNNADVLYSSVQLAWIRWRNDQGTLNNFWEVHVATELRTSKKVGNLPFFFKITIPSEEYMQKAFGT